MRLTVYGKNERVLGWIYKGCENERCREHEAQGCPWHVTPPQFGLIAPNHFRTIDEAVEALEGLQ